MAIYLLQQLCPLVSTYGFGTERLQGMRVPYHYFRFYGAREFGNSKAHSFDTETALFRALMDRRREFPPPGHPWYGRKLRGEPQEGARAHALTHPNKVGPPRSGGTG